MLKENKGSPNIEDLYSKLDMLIAIIAIQNYEDNIDKVLILRKLNYSLKDIAKFVNIGESTVDSYIATLKKQKKLK